MSKVMYVTVGTSLFHSATWEAVPELLREMPSYEEWMAPERLRSPSARQGSDAGALTETKLIEKLRPDNAAEWSRRLPGDLVAGSPRPDTVMRYSAELATIAKLAEQEPVGDVSLRAFLQSYDEIQLVADPAHPASGRNLQWTAAEHLTFYLRSLCGGDQRVKVCAVEGLASGSPEDLFAQERGLGLLLQKLDSALASGRDLDLIVSGGYKIYGIYLGRLLVGNGVRMVYIHEKGGELLVLPGIAGTAPSAGVRPGPEPRAEVRTILSILRQELPRVGRFG